MRMRERGLQDGSKSTGKQERNRRQQEQRMKDGEKNKESGMHVRVNNGACEKEGNRKPEEMKNEENEKEIHKQEGMKNGDKEQEGGKHIEITNRETEEEQTQNGKRENPDMKNGKGKEEEVGTESERGAAEECGAWVRPASRVEVAFEFLGHHEFMLVCCKLSVCSDLPLTHHHLTTALTHLFRKTPNLRVRFGDKEGARWLREMAVENIDFMVECERSVAEVTQSLHTHQYNTTEGPLWCARLLPTPDPHHQTPRFSSFCSHLTPAFPHCYHLLFGFHHSLGDGSTFSKICGAFVSILDDVLAKCPIDDVKQIGKFEVNPDFDKLMASHEEEIENNPVLKKEYIDASTEGQPENSLMDQILPAEPLTAQRKTLLKSQTFDCETTSEFIRRSKMEGITVNSSFAAVCNIALGDLLREKGIQQEKYFISNAHLIDMRRFWDAQVAVDNLGCYINLSNRVFVEVPGDMYQEGLGGREKLEAEQGRFWEVAKDVHRGLHQLLESKDVLRRLAFVTVYMKTFEPHIDRDLSFNAQGDLSHLFADRRHVQATQLINSTAIHWTPLVWEHVTCTVRGRLVHTIKYNSGLVTKDLVTRYMDHIYRRVHQVTTASRIT